MKVPRCRMASRASEQTPRPNTESQLGISLCAAVWLGRMEGLEENRHHRGALLEGSLSPRGSLGSWGVEGGREPHLLHFQAAEEPTTKGDANWRRPTTEMLLHQAPSAAPHPQLPAEATIRIIEDPCQRAQHAVQLFVLSYGVRPERSDPSQERLEQQRPAMTDEPLRRSEALHRCVDMELCVQCVTDEPGQTDRCYRGCFSAGTAAAPMPDFSSRGVWVVVSGEPGFLHMERVSWKSEEVLIEHLFLS
ncbi:hypothetical protein EYF80_001447 [Liparis tanakae]|uniref:Uncharacterized protein n=1 Tax=Liparis tanakae TaxID=230148 RepID=A0A4Z2JDY9_9TELE|nr:hypothetical protein EYF80_001447 [Liparis tanakae]